MTSKEYALLAKHMKHMLGRVNDYPWNFQRQTFDETLIELGNALIEDNHRFDREKFEAAIYGEQS